MSDPDTSPNIRSYEEKVAEARSILEDLLGGETEPRGFTQMLTDAQIVDRIEHHHFEWTGTIWIDTTAVAARDYQAWSRDTNPDRWERDTACAPSPDDDHDHLTEE